MEPGIALHRPRCAGSSQRLERAQPTAAIPQALHSNVVEARPRPQQRVGLRPAGAARGVPPRPLGRSLRRDHRDGRSRALPAAAGLESAGLHRLGHRHWLRLATLQPVGHIAGRRKGRARGLTSAATTDVWMPRTVDVGGIHARTRTAGLVDFEELFVRKLLRKLPTDHALLHRPLLTVRAPRW